MLLNLKIPRGVSKNEYINSLVAYSWLIYWILYIQFLYFKGIESQGEISSVGLIGSSVNALWRAFRTFWNLDGVYWQDFFSVFKNLFLKNSYFLINTFILWIICSKREWKIAIDGFVSYLLSALVFSLIFCFLNLFVSISFDFTFYLAVIKKIPTEWMSLLPSKIADVEAWILFFISAVFLVVAVKSSSAIDR